MKFRLKPVEVDAERWFRNGDHSQDYAKDDVGLEDGELRTFTGAERKAKGWEGSVVRYFRKPGMGANRRCLSCQNYMLDHGWIDGPGGGQTVCPGDWVVTCQDGSYLVRKPEQFAVMFEQQHASAVPALKDVT